MLKKKPREVAVIKNMGWKTCFCARLAPVFWMGDQKKEGARLIFIIKLGGSFETHANTFKLCLVRFGMPNHEQSTLISSLLPKVEVPSKLLWNTLYMRDGWMFILVPVGKEDTYRMEKFCQKVLQPPATLVFSDYPQFDKQQYDISIWFIF